MKVIWISVCLLVSATGWAQTRFASGDLAGFTMSPTEHTINTLDTLLSVRDVEGVVAREPDGSLLKNALIEIRGPGDSKTVLAATASASGEFRIRNVAPGEYVFKITLGGFESLIGKLVVDPHAQRSRPIRLQLKPGP